MKKKMLVLFLVLSLFLFGCEKKEEKVPEEVNEVRELKQTEIDDLLARIEDLKYFDINPAKSFKTTELTNQEVLQWASYGKDMNKMKFSDLEKRAVDYLNFSLEAEDLLCMTHSNILGSSDYSYLYDVSTKSYVKNKNHTNHKITGYYSYVVNRYKESKYENGEYIVKVYKLFSDTSFTGVINNQMRFNWYASYNDAKTGSKAVLRNETAYSNNLKKVSEKNLNTYTYTFRLKDGKYVLKSYVIEQ